MRRLGFLLFVGTLALGGLAWGADERPLDLPAGGAAIVDDEVIVDAVELFTRRYEGDAFVFVIPRAVVMLNGCVWEMFRTELKASISMLGSHTPFNLVAYSSTGVLTWSSTPRSGAIAKVEAKAWIDELTVSGLTEIQEGAIAGIERAMDCEATRPQVVVAGRGGVVGEWILAAINAANVAGVAVHTCYIGTDEITGQFMADIADQQHGTYTNVPIPVTVGGGGD